MKKISNKKLILSLIKDDLINSKLNIGLSNLGLQPELYLLGISDTVFALMGTKDDERVEAPRKPSEELREGFENLSVCNCVQAADEKMKICPSRFFEKSKRLRKCDFFYE